MSDIKLVMVGGGVGKSTILATLTTKKFTEYLPKVFDIACIRIPSKDDNKEYDITAWEISYLEEYETLRNLNYSQTDVFMICYSVVDHDSYNKVLSLWYHDINRYIQFTGTSLIPIILCGTKIDLRDDKHTLDQLAENNLVPITPEQGEEMRKQINADVYCECSSLTQQGLDDLFQHVIKAFVNEKAKVNNKNKKNKNKNKKKKKQQHEQTMPPTSTTTSTNELSLSDLTLSNDSLQPPSVEKNSPNIQGKTLTELLQNQSFDEILSDILAKKIDVYNEIKKEEVEFGKVIASGASGKVYQGRYQDNDVAIKVYSEDNIYFSIDEFDREVTIMTLLDHKCFTKFYGANKEDLNNLFLVSELVKGGSLSNLLLNKQVGLTYSQRLSIAIDIADAMNYLHSLNVIHRDLKSQNVLITEDLRAKVIDFGTSRAIDVSKQMTRNLGTSCWMAPEVFKSQPYTESCDVYSFGIVLWELYCRLEPYEGVSSWTIPVIVCKGERPPIPSDCPADYSKLIKSCWADKAKKRPTFNEIHSTLLKIQNNVNLGQQNKSKK
ncbi:hypothetical protein CYY_005084 [Polysphondylium violaceum]|uniref:Protein kinase domain-containing protein n=1 Tax=Polysphondylium violaceum TaxID=133409 RepID=A0A8J4PUU4_9MYCE|nr:hypothetical protein CYY_005084 [Polysphondylium violaceum]